MVERNRCEIEFVEKHGKATPKALAESAIW
jgi:hypothetical protein